MDHLGLVSTNASVSAAPASSAAAAASGGGLHWGEFDFGLPSSSSDSGKKSHAGAMAAVASGRSTGSWEDLRKEVG